jgi:hypothetical protein
MLTMSAGRQRGGDGGAREHAEQKKTKKKMKGRWDWRGSSCGGTRRKARVSLRSLGGLKGGDGSMA